MIILRTQPWLKMNSLEAEVVEVVIEVAIEAIMIEVVTEAMIEAITEEVTEAVIGEVTGEIEVAAHARCRMICGGGIMKLSAKLIPMTFSKDPAITTIVAAEVVIGTIIVMVDIKTITKTIGVASKNLTTKDSKKMVRRVMGISNVAAINREKEVRVIRTDSEIIPSILEEVEIKMVSKEEEVVIKMVTGRIPGILEAVSHKRGTDLVVAFSRETVRVTN